MKIIKLTLYVFAISFGIFMFIYGEYDDSPGGQLLGLVLAVTGAWQVVKILSRK